MRSLLVIAILGGAILFGLLRTSGGGSAPELLVETKELARSIERRAAQSARVAAKLRSEAGATSAPRTTPAAAPDAAPPTRDRRARRDPPDAAGERTDALAPGMLVFRVAGTGRRVHVGGNDWDARERRLRETGFAIIDAAVTELVRGPRFESIDEHRAALRLALIESARRRHGWWYDTRSDRLKIASKHAGVALRGSVDALALAEHAVLAAAPPR